MTSKNAINLCSLNVNGINLKEKRNRVIEWFKAQNSLITFLQETHFTICEMEHDSNLKFNTCKHKKKKQRAE
jgi:exonuclease III